MYEGWDGISGITGIIGLFVTIISLSAIKRLPDTKSRFLFNYITWRKFASVVLLISFNYLIFYVSVTVVGLFTDQPDSLVYLATVIASFLGAFWGIAWFSQVWQHL